MESSITSSVGKITDVDLGTRCGHVIPTLRKNRRIDNRWGLQYRLAVQYAIFGRECLPYMPTEPPAFLSEEIVESDPLYVCKQCKDCFRFQNSFEDHNKRRTWILGFWCRNCFVTVCTHITDTGSACPICIQKDNDKRSYLRARGLPKNQKLGVVKVFYNQCQLYEHVKMHNISAVDMGDIMLMPLPSDMTNNDWSPELELTCEALMEYTFLLRIHIMDWLKMNKMENNWWKSINNNDTNDNLISKVVKRYQGRQIFKSFEKSTADTYMDFSHVTVHDVNRSSFDIEFIDTNSKDKNKNSHSSNETLDKNVLENEDNPCMSTDIAFVDCGPTSKCFEPESSVGYIRRKRVTVLTTRAQTQLAQDWRLSNTSRTNHNKKGATLNETVSTEIDIVNKDVAITNSKDIFNKNFIIKQLSQDSIQQHEEAQPLVKEVISNSTNKSIERDSKNQDKTLKINVPLSTKKQVKLRKTNTSPSTPQNIMKQNLSTVMTSHSSKVLTIQGPKNADISSIISQLPSQLISNKKVVYIGQDSHGTTIHGENTEKKSSKPILDNNGIDINISSPKKICDSINIKKQQMAGKIMIKNGKKYILKRSESATKSSENSYNLPNMNDVSKTAKGLRSESNSSVSIRVNSNEGEKIGTEQATLLHNESSFLTPSPSPSELSSSSSCESHVKQTLTTSSTKLRKVPLHLISVCSTQKKHMFETISLIKEENEDIYMNVKLLDRIPKEDSRDMCEIIPKCRQEMIDEFYHLNSSELKKRIDHLQQVSEEMRKVMNFISDNVLKEKLRSISILQRILEECFHKCNQNVQIKEDDGILNEWETDLKKVDAPYKCPSCYKIIKPKSYIAGFSKLSKDDNIYCLCYKHVCHECLSYQGTLSRFIAHQNFHKKLKPYVCPDCRCKFTSAKFLEVHTWTVCFHTLKKRIFACKICEIDGFRDMESITRHFVVMHSYTKIACEDCFKVFFSFNEYVKHYTEIHSSMLKQNPIRLVICRLGDEIVRCENYMSYLEKYPGIRKLTWFKCPFCPLITLENKHMTAVLNAHLRDKHLHRLSELISKEALTDLFGTECFESGLSKPSEDSAHTFINTNDALCDDGTVVPKIINTRTIPSEVFERGSQYTDDTWSVNSDASAFSTTDNVNLQTVNKVDKKKTNILPQILDVRSEAHVKSTERKSTTIKTPIGEENTHNIPQYEMDKDENAKEHPLHKDVKEITVELVDNKFGFKEETNKSASRNKQSIASHISESEKYQSSTVTDDTHTTISSESNKKGSDFKTLAKTNTDSRIKVVDIRKICKPNVKPFVADELCETLPENENNSYTIPIQKPPPLARIPQHLFQIKSKKSENKSKNITMSKKFLTRNMTGKPRWRIALNGPVSTQEECIDYLCHLCGDQINTSWPVLRTHFREKHSHEYQLAVITPRLLRLSSDFINGDYKQLIISKKRKSDSVLYTSKRKRRWTPKKYAETKDMGGLGVGFCVEEVTAEDGEGNFKCKKCDQRCTDMSDLREHIASNHRLKGRYLICLECGENFVVAPSLQMHLKAFHGIDDPISYMTQNPSYAPDVSGESEMEGKTTVANQCYVCMAVFEDKAAVDKHLRVHGMAFLNRKRIEARNALKGSDKKINMNDKQNLAEDTLKEPMKRDNPSETILEKLNATV